MTMESQVKVLKSGPVLTCRQRVLFWFSSFALFLLTKAVSFPNAKMLKL